MNNSLGLTPGTRIVAGPSEDRLLGIQNMHDSGVSPQDLAMDHPSIVIAIESSDDVLSVRKIHVLELFHWEGSDSWRIDGFIKTNNQPQHLSLFDRIRLAFKSLFKQKVAPPQYPVSIRYLPRTENGVIL